MYSDNSLAVAIDVLLRMYVSMDAVFAERCDVFVINPCIMWQVVHGADLRRTQRDLSARKLTVGIIDVGMH
jgi:hypothetical protein